MVLRDRNKLKPPNRYNVQSFIANWVEPLNYDEAITGLNMDIQITAMDDEIKSLNENETWTLVNLVQNKIALRNAWVFKTKYKIDCNIRR